MVVFNLISAWFSDINLFIYFLQVLFEQFRFFLNFYFLMIAITQFLPALRIGELYTYWAPLVSVCVCVCVCARAHTRMCSCAWMWHYMHQNTWYFSRIGLSQWPTNESKLSNITPEVAPSIDIPSIRIVYWNNIKLGCMCVWVSVSMSVSVSVCLSVCLSVHVFLYVCVRVHAWVCMGLL